MNDDKYLDQIGTQDLIDEIKRRTNGIIFEGTKEEWNSLSDAQRAVYKTVIITND